MKPLDRFELALPQFVNEQELFAEHLNAMNNFFSVLLLKRFTSLPQKGIVRGFAVTVDEKRKNLCVSPGLAVDADGQLIFLPEERKIPLPEVQPPAPTIVFVAKVETGTVPMQKDNDSLGQFTCHSCCLGYVTCEELISDPKLIEIARVKFASGSALLSKVVRPTEWLNPKANELDFREVIWLGETEVGGLRPELQQELAKLTSSLATEVQLNQLAFAVLQALVTVPSFCQRGLLSREQLIEFIGALLAVRKRLTESLDSCSNTQLVEKLYDMKNEAPADFRLTQEYSHGLIDLNRHESVTVRLNYAPELVTFVLCLQRHPNGQIHTQLLSYPKEFRDRKIFHAWDDDRDREQALTYPGTTAPKKLLFSTNIKNSETQYGIRQGFVECRFQEQDRRIFIEMIVAADKTDYWPRVAEQRRIEIHS